MVNQLARKTITIPSTFDHQVDEIIKLRHQGHTYGYIANVLGLSTSQVAGVLQREAARILEDRDKLITEYIFKQLAECDFMMRRLMEPYHGNDDLTMKADVINAAVKLQERVARLLGLDTPMKTETKLTLETRSDEELKQLAEANGLTHDL